MIFLDYLALICVIILAPFNRQALLFVSAFILSEIFYFNLGFASADGGLIYSAATAISFVLFTILAAALRFHSVLILSLIAYWLLYFFSAIDYSLTTSANQFDGVFPWAIKIVDLIVITHLYSYRGPIISFNSKDSVIIKQINTENQDGS